MLGLGHHYFGYKSSTAAVKHPGGVMFVHHGAPFRTPRQQARVVKRLKQVSSIPKIKEPKIKEPKLLGAHPLHSSHIHAITGANISPVHIRSDVPKVRMPVSNFKVPKGMPMVGHRHRI